MQCSEAECYGFVCRITIPEACHILWSQEPTSTKMLNPLCMVKQLVKPTYKHILVTDENFCRAFKFYPLLYSRFPLLYTLGILH